MKKSKKETVDIEATEASEETVVSQPEVSEITETKSEKIAIKDRLKGSATKVKDSLKSKKDLVAANYSNLWIKYRGRSKKFKILSTITIIIISIILLIALNEYIFKLDRNLFETNVVGYVREQDGLPIDGVKVCLKDDCVETNANGQFEFQKQVYGFNKFSLSKEDYKTLTKNSYLSRGDNSKNYVLELSGKAIVSGKVEITSGVQDYSKFKVSIDDQVGTIDQSGNFSVRKIESGVKKLVVSSAEFSDVEKEVDLKDGVNNVGTFQLTPAADVSFKMSDFVEGGPIEDAEFSTNVENMTVTKLDANNYVLKDIDFSVINTIAITATKPGYVTKTQTIESIKQGDNSLGNFELVRVGRVVFLSNKSGYSHLYSANYDGTEEILLSDVGNANNKFYSLNSNGDYVGFLSDKDKLKDKNNNVQFIPYISKMAGGDLRRMGKYSVSDKSTAYWFDFDYNKVAYTKSTGAYSTSQTDLYVANMDGTGEKSISKTGGGYYEEAIFSKDGKYIAYDFVDYSAKLYAVYIYNLSTGQTREVFKYSATEYATLGSFAPDSQSLLIRVKDGEGEFEMWQLGTTANSTKKIFASKVAFSYIQYSPDGKLALYTSTRDGQLNIYQRDLEDLSEERVSEDESVIDYIFTKEGYILYTTNEGELKILSLSSKPNSKKVVDQAKGFYSVDYNYYY